MLKVVRFLSRACAFLGGFLGLAVSVTVLTSVIIDRNWGAIPFILFPTIINLAILVFEFRYFGYRHLPFIYAGIGLLQIFFIYLSRFSIGLFLAPSTLFILIAALLNFVDHKKHLRENHLNETSDAVPFAQQQAWSQQLTAALTSRETQVLRLLMQGLTNQEIAEQLFISQNTVRRHVHDILRKLKCSSRTQAAMIGRKEGLS
jgi:RNA polymerase sigma factor (sigma-70 family)